MTKNKKGFTLAETLVALAVASLITMILVTGVMSASKIKTNVSKYADSEYLATTILTSLEDELRFANLTNESGSLTWNSSTFGDNTSLFLDPNTHKVYIKSEISEGNIKTYKLISDEAYLDIGVDDVKISAVNDAYEIYVKVGNVEHTTAIRNYSIGESILTPDGCEVINIPGSSNPVCGNTTVGPSTSGVSNFHDISGGWGTPNWAFNIEAGVPFSINGTLYITIAPNQYYSNFATHPSSADIINRPEYRDRFVEIPSTSKTYTRSDIGDSGHWLFQVNKGDFYSDGGNLYVCHTPFNDAWGLPNMGYFTQVKN